MSHVDELINWTRLTSQNGAVLPQNGAEIAEQGQESVEIGSEIERFLLNTAGK
jgi:hypothetical protein